MKQIIYTCPIAVMWQIKHHNIRFQWRKIESKGFWQDVVLSLMGINFNIKEFRVHPDDLHLCEPKEGDYADYNGYGGEVDFDEVDGQSLVILGCSFCGLTKEEFIVSLGVSILMRDGKPWINPCEIRESDSEGA